MNTRFHAWFDSLGDWKLLWLILFVGIPSGLIFSMAPMKYILVWCGILAFICISRVLYLRRK